MSLVQHINRKRPRTFRNSNNVKAAAAAAATTTTTVQDNSTTSSPRNSSTPIIKTSAIASSTNPFIKNGFNSSDPICLDSDNDEDNANGDDNFYFAATNEHSNLNPDHLQLSFNDDIDLSNDTGTNSNFVDNHKITFPTSEHIDHDGNIKNNNNNNNNNNNDSNYRTGNDYDSDDSIIIVEERKVPQNFMQQNYDSAIVNSPALEYDDDNEDNLNPFSNENALNEFGELSSRNESLNLNEDSYFKPAGSYHSDSSFNSGLHSLDNNSNLKLNNYGNENIYYDNLYNSRSDLGLTENNNNTVNFAQTFNNNDGAAIYLQNDATGTTDSPAIKKHKASTGLGSQTYLPQVLYAKENYQPIKEFHPKLNDLDVPVIPAALVKKEHHDEDNGHYKVEIGKSYSNGRFTIKKLLGQGTFGKVVATYDNTAKRHVAIKIIKAIPKYRDAAKIELRVLSTLKQFDKSNSNHCIHLNEVFDCKNHISLVTDLLSLSVFDFFDQNGFKSFPGSHIQSFAKQLLKSVVFLHDLNIIHTDLKPENILLYSTDHSKKFYFEANKFKNNTNSNSSGNNNNNNGGGGGSEKGNGVSNSSKKSGNNSNGSSSCSSNGSSSCSSTDYSDPKKSSNYRKILHDTKINLIDFGSAVFNNEYHPELVSTRHYRAPEIAFGIGWAYECDMWSVGCILVEILIGEALFNTHDNREHLLMMEKVTNERLDLNLIKNCCVQNQKQLHNMRESRKPYAAYGNHYVLPFKRRHYSDSSSGDEVVINNGYGSYPCRFSQTSVNQDVYEFLRQRDESYLKLKDDYKFDSAFVGLTDSQSKFLINNVLAPNGASGYGSANGNDSDGGNVSPDSQNQTHGGVLSTKLKRSRGRPSKKLNDMVNRYGNTGKAPGLGYVPTGLKKIKQKFPKDISSKTKKVVNELAPVEEIISNKIGINIDMTLSLDEAYFKYCLEFSDESTNKKLFLSLGSNNGTPISANGNVGNSDANFANGDRFFKNLNSVAGGCMSSEWFSKVQIANDKPSFFMDLIEKIEDNNKSTIPNIGHKLYNLVLEAINRRNGSYNNANSASKLKKLYAKYPASLIGDSDIYLNGSMAYVEKFQGPVDKDTFRFWYNFIDLLKKLLVFNPYKRLTAYEALNHEWFNCGIFDDGTIQLG